MDADDVTSAMTAASACNTEPSASNSGVKFIKVWTADGKIRKGVLACTFEGLKEKCCEKFGIEAADSEVQFCLREDGTEVDAECFAAVQSNTVLLILKEGEMWSPAENQCNKTTDCAVPKDTVAKLMERIREGKKKADNQTNKRTDPDKVRMLAGWMHYSYTANRYIQKKTTKILPSGGTETLSFRRTLDYHQTTRVMTDKFFPKGKNIAGKLKDMETRLGNSKGEELPEEGFTASNYFYSSDKQVVRIYLLTKTKLFEIVSGSDTDDDFIPDLLGVDQATIGPNTGSQSSTGGQISQSPVPVPMNQDVLTPRSAGSSSMPLSGLPLMNTGTTGTPTITFQERKCTICFDREIDSFFLPCGHTSCMVCGVQIQSLGQACLTCRMKIIKVNSMFK